MLLLLLLLSADLWSEFALHALQEGRQAASSCAHSCSSSAGSLRLRLSLL